MTTLRTGDTGARTMSRRIAAPVANVAALATVGIANAADGQTALDISTGNTWRFSAACALTADNILVAGSGSGNGRWLLVPGARDLSFPITFATADAAILWTVPTGAVVHVLRGYWEVTADFTGGSSSAIGLSSSQSPHNTKGDLHGGVAGDVAATLVASVGNIEGTIGVDIAAGVVLRAGSTVRFDRITSVFAAGTGNAHLIVNLLKNPGA